MSGKEQEHMYLEFEVMDVDGRTIDRQRMPAPVNRNAAAVCSIQINAMHADGCKHQLVIVPLPPYD